MHSKRNLAVSVTVLHRPTNLDLVLEHIAKQSSMSFQTIHHAYADLRL